LEEKKEKGGRGETIGLTHTSPYLVYKGKKKGEIATSGFMGGPCGGFFSSS